MAVTFEDSFAQATKVRLVLTPQRVAGRAMTVRHDLLAAAATVKRALCALFHTGILEGFVKDIPHHESIEQLRYCTSFFTHNEEWIVLP